MFKDLITNPIIYFYLIGLFILLDCYFLLFKTRAIQSANIHQSSRFRFHLLFVLMLLGFFLLNEKFSFALLDLFSVERSSNNNAPDVIVMATGNSKINSIDGIKNINSTDLLRLNAAIWWQKQTGVKLVISGVKDHNITSYKHLKELKNYAINQGIDRRQILLDDFSTNTDTHPLGLKKLGFNQNQTVGIVSNHWHEKRLHLSFKRYYPKLVFIEHKVFYHLEEKWSGYLPSAKGIENIRIIIYESMALIWYQLKYLFETD